MRDAAAARPDSYQIMMHQQEYRSSLNFIFFYGSAAMTLACILDMFLSYAAGYAFVAIYDLVCAVIAIPLIVSAILFPRQRSLAIIVILYIFLVNIYGTNIYYLVSGNERFDENLLKDLFFIAAMITGAGFSGHRLHSLIIGILTSIFVVITGVLSGNLFLRDNVPPIVVTTIALAIGFYLFVGSLEKVSYEKICNKLLLEKQHTSLQEMLSGISKDLEMAARVQSSLLSHDVNRFDSSVFAAYTRPMIDVGGDIFDVFTPHENRCRLFIADANGHGVQAALVTMLIKNEYDRIKEWHADPHEIMLHLNKIFTRRHFRAEMLFTCAIIDVDFVRNTVMFASAGHPAQYLIHEGRIFDLKSKGPLIGVVSDAQYETEVHDFAENDTLLMFTDGIFEIRSPAGDPMGEERIKQYLSLLYEKNAGLIIEGIVSFSEAFAEGTAPIDDIALLALKHRGILSRIQHTGSFQEEGGEA